MAPYESVPWSSSLLLPTVSSAMNLGLAIGGYAMTLPFATPGIPGAAVAVWFDRFFLPGFVSVTTLGLTTLIFGFRGFRASRNQYASRTALLGLLFSVVHFGFGNSVLAIMERMKITPADAQIEMASWVRLHVTRTLVADMPAFLCFFAGLISQMS